MRRVVPAVLALLLLAPAALTGCTADEPDPPAVEHTAPTDEPALLQVRGNGFVAAGQPVALTGFNLYDAAATPAYACRPSTALTEQQLRNLFAQMRDRAGANVVRFWAYQTYTDAGRDLSAVDRVIRVARAEGMWVIPVLEDGPGDCTTDPAQTPKLRHDGDTYYLTGYTQAHGNTHLSLLEYARLMAEHYADEPTIAAWMIMNEAETHARTEDGRSALVPFAEHVGRTIKDADPNHLVTLGTQANGAPGASGPDFHDIYALAQMDFAEAHDWPHRHGGPEHALPGMWTGSPSSSVKPESRPAAQPSGRSVPAIWTTKCVPRSTQAPTDISCGRPTRKTPTATRSTRPRRTRCWSGCESWRQTCATPDPPRCSALGDRPPRRVVDGHDPHYNGRAIGAVHAGRTH
ncbi:MAG: hypothetical protein CSB46_03285 [Micrococcales bacterium]|nr:MAG: hypothetical protein CSB46_03285 [Micrococcales bacterium]